MNKYEPEQGNNEKSGNARERADSTPLLPLPSLRDTTEQFTNWCTPFLTNEQRAETRAALNIFTRPNGLGERLHEKLKQDAEQARSQKLARQLLDRSFSLGDVTATSVNENYFFLFRPCELTRTKQAAGLICSCPQLQAGPRYRPNSSRC